MYWRLMTLMLICGCASTKSEVRKPQSRAGVDYDVVPSPTPRRLRGEGGVSPSARAEDPSSGDVGCTSQQLGSGQYEEWPDGTCFYNGGGGPSLGGTPLGRGAGPAG